MSTPQYEPLLARVLITFDNGSEIAYAYNRESIEALGLPVDTYDKSIFIQEGSILTLNDERYKVVRTNFKLSQHMNEMDHGYGINIFGMTEPSNFNCQIGLFVERVN